MAFRVRRVEYFYATVRDQAGEAFKVLSALAGRGVNLVAFTAVPVGPTSSQLAIFPDDPALLRTEATHARLALDGGHFALLVQGDDELGVARIHKRLYDANISVYASSGIADRKGSFATSSTSARRTSPRRANPGLTSAYARSTRADSRQLARRTRTREPSADGQSGRIPKFPRFSPSEPRPGSATHGAREPHSGVGR